MSATKDNLPYSVHSFMLPFRWDYLPEGFSHETGKEAISFDERTDLNQFLTCLLDGNSRWRRSFYTINGKTERYNEFHYFQPYTLDTIFDLQKPDEKDETQIHANKVMVFFEYKTDVRTDTFTIRTLENDNYTLALRCIYLHVYNTGVAILTINLDNNRYQKREAVCCINEFGRRLYPQFLTEDSDPVQKAKEAFLPASIEISISGVGIIEEDFCDYHNIDKLEVYHQNKHKYEYSWVTRTPQHIRKLFGSRFSFITNDAKPGTVNLNALADDRMFFMCWYGYGEKNNGFETNPSEKVEALSKTEAKLRMNKYGNYWYSYPYLNDEDWYGFMHGDKDRKINISNRQHMHKLLEKNTYARWAGDGILLGITIDSLVAISKMPTDCTDNGRPLMRTKMKTVHYQTAVLCLAQRASMLRFSSELTKLADLARSNNNKKLVENIKILYKNYIEFINKIYYREISPYGSGIELYNQIHDVMDIREEIKELDKELNGIFTYVRLEEEEKQSDEAHRLNIVAHWFLPASFIAALFGVSFGDLSGCNSQQVANTNAAQVHTSNVITYWLCIIAIGVLVSYILLKITKKRKI